MFDFLNETIQTLISSGGDEQNLMNDFSKYLQYSDIKYFSIKSLLNIVKNKSREQTNGGTIDEESNQNTKPNAKTDDKPFSDNVTKLLLAVRLPLGNTEKGQRELDNLRPFILDDLFKFNYESASKLYSDTWLIFLSFGVIV